MDGEEAVIAALRSRGAKVPHAWAHECLRFWRMTIGPRDAPANWLPSPSGEISHPSTTNRCTDLPALAWAQFIQTDLRQLGIPQGLPDNVNGLMTGSLQGSFLLQVDEWIDVSRPITQFNEEDDTGEGLFADEEDQTSQKRITGGSRVLKLALTDGVQGFVAAELNPVPELPAGLRPGFKLILHKAEMQRGVAWLTPGSVQPLGGECLDLIERVRASGRIVDAPAPATTHTTATHIPPPPTSPKTPVRPEDSLERERRLEAAREQQEAWRRRAEGSVPLSTPTGVRLKRLRTAQSSSRLTPSQPPPTRSITNGWKSCPLGTHELISIQVVHFAHMIVHSDSQYSLILLLNDGRFLPVSQTVAEDILGMRARVFESLSPDDQSAHLKNTHDYLPRSVPVDVTLEWQSPWWNASFHSQDTAPGPVAVWIHPSLHSKKIPFGRGFVDWK